MVSGEHLPGEVPCLSGHRRGLALGAVLGLTAMVCSLMAVEFAGAAVGEHTLVHTRAYNAREPVPDTGDQSWAAHEACVAFLAPGGGVDADPDVEARAHEAALEACADLRPRMPPRMSMDGWFGDWGGRFGNRMMPPFDGFGDGFGGFFDGPFRSPRPDGDRRGRFGSWTMPPFGGFGDGFGGWDGPFDGFDGGFGDWNGPFGDGFGGWDGPFCGFGGWGRPFGQPFGGSGGSFGQHQWPPMRPDPFLNESPPSTGRRGDVRISV